ncbi:MAG: hypothetical protein KBS52_06500 [Clostridiales bacterium]|nr:hypothetical protein [Candidatus Equinaster intestinalis]
MIPLRQDEYGLYFYIEKGGETLAFPFKSGKFSFFGIDFCCSLKENNGVLEVRTEYSAKTPVRLERFGLRLGIDCYMEKYPEWEEKFFPTALRCEKQGFWSCFCSPSGKMLSVCSGSDIVSWKNEYNKAVYGSALDVGHRIYTSSVEFINTYKQPSRHPESPKTVFEKREAVLFYSYVSDKKELACFVKKYAGIILPDLEKYSYEPWENAQICGKTVKLDIGVNTFTLPNTAQIKLYKRKDWFDYLRAAAKFTEKCQQKGGSHCEAWYGFFTLCLYAKELGNSEYTQKLTAKFDAFFENMTVNGHFKREALPERLQNLSSMVSLLTDFYTLTGKEKYLDFAEITAADLMSRQINDGSFVCDNTHYTCVIYPAKSLLELYEVCKKAGRKSAKKYYESAAAAVANLDLLKGNIGTEGEQTFEDGMISCEVLQLGFFALRTQDKKLREKYTVTAEQMLEKHRALEQNFLPDCRMRGATLRFWEARYDLNYFVNAVSAPHGWTSWKTYAVYYLYLLTGKLEYLRDLMDTVCACMQCVAEDGRLFWGFIADPCVVGKSIKKSEKIEFETRVAGEEYLPMISDWYRQGENELKCQYIKNPENPDEDFGGSCDNDVSEHFKALHETVFGKAFIHQTESGEILYNCQKNQNGFETQDKFVKEIVYFAKEKTAFNFGGKKYEAKKGINIIEL